MPNLRIFKLCRLSPIHIGTGREGYDMAASQLLSDTLSAALASLAVSHGATADAKAFLSSFRISSAFPFWGDHYFLPKPLGRLNVRVKGQEEFEYRKRLKKVSYIEVPLWEELSAGKSLTIEESQLQGQFLVTPDTRMGRVCQSQVSQRVSVPRDGSDDASPFFFDWHYYDRQAGLYCLTDAEGETAELLTSLFERLGEAGIGTDRNIGGGHFEVETGSLSITEPTAPDATVTLSLYLPRKDELSRLFHPAPRYALQLRGGYMAGSSVETFRHLRRRAVYMFGTGSVFFTTDRLEGALVDLRPQWNDPAMHPVWRSGRPLTLSIKTNEHDES